MTRLPIVIPLMGFLLLCWGGKLKGQSSVDPNRLESVRTQLAQTKSVLDKVPTSQRGALSSGAQIFFKWQTSWIKRGRTLVTPL
jgi:hypothetical protein